MSEANPLLAMGAHNTKLALRPAPTLVGAVAADHGCLSQLRRLYSEKLNFKCKSCQSDYTTYELQSNVSVWLIPQRFGQPSRPAQLALLRCKKCRRTLCLGCGEPKKEDSEVIELPDASGSLSNCCEGGMLLGVWLVLSFYDEKDLELRKALENATNAIAKQRAPVDPDGVSGVGYEAGYGSYGTPKSSKASSPTVGKGEMSDIMITTTISLLVAYLQMTSAVSDPIVGGYLQAMFRVSLLLDRVCALIRNDSISDLTSRSSLYKIVFQFLGAFANHPDLSKLLFERQPCRKNSAGLRALSEGSSNLNNGFEDASLSGPSVFESFRNTYQQATQRQELDQKLSLAKGRKSKPDEEGELCQAIVRAYKEMKSKTPLSTLMEPKEPVDPWKEFMANNRLTFTDEVLENHKFTKSFPSLKTSNQPRARAINQSIASLTTSLPDGIFVKVADSRSDVMKVLIIGVEGSPYAGGLFVFDLLLPAGFPNLPPKINFVLEGTDRDLPPMNPNLHPGGTVCLSILNTWEGSPEQMWQPGKSTILAVLVSIQAMILGVPLPFLNEPGYESLGATREAVMHKQQIQVKTVRHAMITWLTKIKGPDAKAKTGLWYDIAKTYWKYNGQSVLETAKEWTNDNSVLKAFDPSAPTAIAHSQFGQFGFTAPPTPTLSAPTKSASRTEDLVDKLEALLVIEDEEKVAVAQEVSDLEAAMKPPVSNEREPSSSVTTAIGSTVGEFPSGSSNYILSPPPPEMDKNKKGKRKADGSPSYNETTTSKSKKSFTTTKRQKTSLDDDHDEDLADLFAIAGSGAPTSAGASSAALHISTSKTWAYAGDHSLEKIRQACKEFGVKPARSIKESIERLQKEVNDKRVWEGKWKSELTSRWGVLGRPAGDDEEDDGLN